MLKISAISFKEQYTMPKVELSATRPLGPSLSALVRSGNLARNFLALFTVLCSNFNPDPDAPIETTSSGNAHPGIPLYPAPSKEQVHLA